MMALAVRECDVRVGASLPGFNVDLTIYLFVHQPLCALAMTADEHIWNRCVGIAAE